ncbi:MAG: hypothetical protein ACE5IM_11285, partial [Nitrospinota bacterium]
MVVGGKTIEEIATSKSPIMDRVGGVFDMQLQSLSLLSDIEIAIGGMKNDPPRSDEDKRPENESLDARVTRMR